MVVNKHISISNDSLSEADIAHISGKVYQLVSSSPSTIIPIVKSNPGIFLGGLQDMENIH